MFKKYEYVYAIYETGSFTKAAEQLFISQPSLSVAIANIEQKIGASLFVRTGSGAKLTPIGHEYIAAAEKMNRAEQEFRNRLHDMYELETGKLVVGGTSYLSSYVLPPIIKRFSAQFPKIDVSLIEGKSTDLAAMIEQETLDLVVDNVEEHLDNYHAAPLLQEELLLCVPSEFPVNEQYTNYQIDASNIVSGTKMADGAPPIPLSAFKNEPFILLNKGNDMHTHSLNLFAHEKISPSVSFYVDQLSIAYALAANGMGICFATDTLFRYGYYQSEKIKLYRPQGNNARTLYIAHGKNTYCTRAMREFIRVAQDVMKRT